MKNVRMMIENGAFTNVPAYESREGGKNWMARVERDSGSPGGLSRDFAFYARGNYYYIVPSWWEVGDVLEFGADYYASGRRKKTCRLYGVVLEMTEAYWEVAVFETKDEAFSLSERMKSGYEEKNAEAQFQHSVSF